MNRNLPDALIRRIEELVDASFSGRDELYAAADTLDDEKRSNVCRQLADHLADHATELQQILAINGEDTVTPLDMYSVAETFFTLAKNRDGEAGILTAAESCERLVKERFDEVIDQTSDEDTAALLRRHRNDIEFGEHVLRSMQEPPDEETTSDRSN